jgi:hypothetical protein
MKKKVSRRSLSPSRINSTSASNPTQKCNAKQPCTGCIRAKTVSECIYDNEKRPQLTGTYPSHWTDGRPSVQQPRGSDPIEVPRSILYYSPSDGAFADVPWSARLDGIPSTSFDATRVVTNEPAALQYAFGTDRVPRGELVLARRNQLGQRVSPDTSPSISTVPSFFLPTIPREQWIPLSFLGEERLQVQFSEGAATDLDIKSCVSK